MICKYFKVSGEEHKTQIYHVSETKIIPSAYVSMKTMKYQTHTAGTERFFFMRSAPFRQQLTWRRPPCKSVQLIVVDICFYGPDSINHTQFLHTIYKFTNIPFLVAQELNQKG